MDRKYQLEFCKICDNKAFNRNKGIICKLTGDIAAFEEYCNDFTGDHELTPFVQPAEEISDSDKGDILPEGFPPKPEEETKKQSINRSLFSIALFIGAFYLIFKWEITYILILAGVILLHEAGHFISMRIFRYNDLGIFFVPLLGAFASGSKETVSQKQNVIILLAGPLPGIVIGLILYYFGLKNESEFLLRTSNIFILLNIFNLLPVMPLDGGRVIKSLFFENNELINRIFLLISVAALTFYCLSSHSYVLLVIPFFLLTQLSMQSQVKKVKEAVSARSVNVDKTFSELSDEEYWLIRDEIGTQLKYFDRFITPEKYIKSDNEQRIIKQVKNILEKKPAKDLKVSGKILIMAIWLLFLIGPFILILIYYIQLGIEL